MINATESNQSTPDLVPKRTLIAHKIRIHIQSSIHHTIQPLQFTKNKFSLDPLHCRSKEGDTYCTGAEHSSSLQPSTRHCISLSPAHEARQIPAQRVKHSWIPLFESKTSVTCTYIIQNSRPHPGVVTAALQALVLVWKNKLRPNNCRINLDNWCP
jgi:hypothetical protein